jgi:hypothetical protein
MTTQTTTFFVHTSQDTFANVQAKQEFRFTAGLCVFAALALVSGICGLAIGAASIFDLIDSHSWISIFGTLLLCLSFPLMIVAAHFMDKLSDLRKAARIESCKKTGMRQ